MKNLTIIESQADNINLEYGFFHIEFTNGHDNYLLQMCLNMRVDKNGSKKSFNPNDDGMDWGICGDANEKAFDKFGYDDCVSFLHSAAKGMGVRVE